MSHSKFDNMSPSPLNFLINKGSSLTLFNNTNQCPGGVSDSGPSAQNSAKTLV
jgi:hypothetical protein